MGESRVEAFYLEVDLCESKQSLESKLVHLVLFNNAITKSLFLAIYIYFVYIYIKENIYIYFYCIYSHIYILIYIYIF